MNFPDSQSLSGHLYLHGKRRSNSKALSFYETNISVTVLSSVHFLQMVLDNSRSGTQSRYVMSASTAFGAQLYFHTAVLKTKNVGKKMTNIVQNAVISGLLRMAVQFVQKA